MATQDKGGGGGGTGSRCSGGDWRSGGDGRSIGRGRCCRWSIVGGGLPPGCAPTRPAAAGRRGEHGALIVVNDTRLLDAIFAKDKQVALRLAADRGFTSLELLDTSGCNALHHAARAGWAELTRILLERDPALAQVVTRADRTPGRWTALHCATDTAVGRGYALDEQVEVVQLLTAHTPADLLMLQSNKGNTVLHHAASRGYVALLPSLVEACPRELRGDFINMENHRGLTPLDLAFKNNMEAVRILKVAR